MHINEIMGHLQRCVMTNGHIARTLQTKINAKTTFSLNTDAKRAADYVEVRQTDHYAVRTEECHRSSLFVIHSRTVS